MERNEDYWGEPGVAKEIVFRTITDNSARVVALTNGEVDIIDGIDANVVEQITAAGCVLNQVEGHEHQLSGLQHRRAVRP